MIGCEQIPPWGDANWHDCSGGRTRAPPDPLIYMEGLRPPTPPLMSAFGLPNYWLFNEDLNKKLINKEAGG